MTAITILTVLLLPNATHAQTPTPQDALTSFHTADRYIRAWSVPTTPITKDSDPKQNPRAVGVCLTLKLRGEVIARGVAWSDAIAGPDAFDPDLIRKAALAAIQQGEPKLGVPNDAMRDESIKQVVKDIAISIELAGPLSAVEFTTWDDAELTLRPGLDGVAAQIRTLSASEGSKPSSSGPLQTIFPSQMMLSNMLPHRAMAAAVSKALGEGGAAAALEDPKKLREQSAVRMYRFRVAHAAQASSTASPRLLYRGERLISDGQALTVQELRDVAFHAAHHLLDRAVAAPEARLEASRPSAFSQLLAAYAVARWSDLVNSPALWPDTPIVKQAREAERVAPGLGVPAISALASNAGVPHYPPPGKAMSLHAAKFKAMTWAVFAPELLAEPLQPELIEYVDPSRVPAEIASVVALAAIRSSPNASHDYPVFVGTDALVRKLFKGGGDARLVSLMPWLGWAEIAQAEATRTPNSQFADLPGALALRRMREQVWKHQLSATDVTEDTLDMAGGIVFTSGLGDGGGHANPYPTWQCVRPLAFIATMLGDPRLTEPNERPREIAHLMQAMRFLRQLQVDEAASWMYPDPKAALGGIRAATWDNSQPTDATSLTLLCVVELLKSLDQLSVSAAPQAPELKKDVADEPRTK